MRYQSVAETVEIDLQDGRRAAELADRVRRVHHRSVFVRRQVDRAGKACVNAPIQARV